TTADSAPPFGIGCSERPATSVVRNGPRRASDRRLRQRARRAHGRASVARPAAGGRRRVFRWYGPFSLRAPAGGRRFEVLVRDLGSLARTTSQDDCRRV